MKQGRVQFHFMCKLYVGPKGMQYYYTVYSPISISMKMRFPPGSVQNTETRQLLQNSYIEKMEKKRIMYFSVLFVVYRQISSENLRSDLKHAAENVLL